MFKINMNERLPKQNRNTQPTELSIQELLARKSMLENAVRVNGGGLVSGADHPLFELLPPGLQREVAQGNNVLIDTLANYQVQIRQNPSEK